MKNAAKRKMVMLEAQFQWNVSGVMKNSLTSGMLTLPWFRRLDIQSEKPKWESIYQQNDESGDKKDDVPVEVMVKTSAKSKATLRVIVTLKVQRIKCWKVIKPRKMYDSSLGWIENNACSISEVTCLKTITSIVQATLGNFFFTKKFKHLNSQVSNVSHIVLSKY